MLATLLQLPFLLFVFWRTHTYVVAYYCIYSTMLSYVFCLYLMRAQETFHINDVVDARVEQIALINARIVVNPTTEIRNGTVLIKARTRSGCCCTSSYSYWHPSSGSTRLYDLSFLCRSVCSVVGA